MALKHEKISLLGLNGEGGDQIAHYEPDVLEKLNCELRADRAPKGALQKQLEQVLETENPRNKNKSGK